MCSGAVACDEEARRPRENQPARCFEQARSHRSDDLTAMWVPDEDSEAMRDRVRAREAAKQDQLGDLTWRHIDRIGSRNRDFSLTWFGHALWHERAEEILTSDNLHFSDVRKREFQGPKNTNTESVRTNKIRYGVMIYADIQLICNALEGKCPPSWSTPPLLTGRSTGLRSAPPGQKYPLARARAI
jgi:hypothetical protein